MAVSNTLMMALLSLDSYNRGYAPAMQISNSTQLGNATIGGSSSTTQGSAEVNDSFFAQSYTWNGKIIISYRGTDNLGVDSLSGYGLSFGNGNSPQAKYAYMFYKSFGPAANIELTGHSLGGGLAGYVSALSGKSATIFDNMAFEAGTNNLLTDTSSAYGTTRNEYFGSSQTRPQVSFPVGNITAYSIDGEINDYTRAVQGQLTPVGELFAGESPNWGLTNDQLHSQSLLVISLFANEEEAANITRDSHQFPRPGASRIADR